jgi:hypothetical protein
MTASPGQCQVAATSTVQTTAGRLDDEAPLLQMAVTVAQPGPFRGAGVEYAIARQRAGVAEDQHDDITLAEAGGNLAHRRR